MNRLSYFPLFIFIVVVIVVVIALMSCGVHPAIQEARDRWKPVQWEPIPPPVDLSHCDKNTIIIGKPRCK